MTIETRQLNDIATWMVPIRETQLPSLLKGVFFMDGNPLPDDCITLENLDWDAKNLSLLLPVTAPFQWTFHKSVAGDLLLLGAQLTQFSYQIQFEDETLTRAQITPLFWGIPIPRELIDATMCLHEGDTSGDTWERKTLWLGGSLRVGEYTLRRIVTAEREYTPAFQEMLTRVENDCLVVTRG